MDSERVYRDLESGISTDNAPTPSPQPSVPNTKIAISVKNLSKSYKMYPSPTERMKELLHPFGKKYHRDFWALRDISFELEQGGSFGIIGRNGSGKSTLLQVICGILQPTEGGVSVDGRISALLELGAGFNKEFTGRENVFFQGAIMGITKEEMEERFDDIANFADIGHFIEQPAKTYSSGMYVRLAFAVAINVDPDILIVDEALAVGDAMFQRRCYKKIDDLKEKGVTLLFVSHASQTVITLCDRALLLNKGKAVDIGKSKEVVNTYTQLLADEEEEYLKKLKGVRKEIKVISQVEKDDRLETPGDSKKGVKEFRVGSGDAEIVEVKILNGSGESVTILEKGEDYTIRFVGVFKKDTEKSHAGMAITTLTGIILTGARAISLDPMRKGDVLTSDFNFKVLLNPDTYALNVGFAEYTSTHRRDMDARRGVMTFRVYEKSKKRIGDSPIGIVDMGFSISTSVQSKEAV